MGKRVDVLLLIGTAVYVIEYKVGEDRYSSHAIDQVTDYALDLKNFHETSHDRFIVPVLVATEAPDQTISLSLTPHNDKLFSTVRCNGHSLGDVIRDVHTFIGEVPSIDCAEWEGARYRPTPTIIEAATALYNEHSVAEISRSDAA